MKKILAIIIGVAVIVAIAAGAWYVISSDTSTNNELSDTGDTVAVVNGAEISRADFEVLRQQIAAQQGIDVASLDAEAQSQFDAQVVDGLVAQVLLQQAVTASGVVASQEDVDAQIGTTAEQLGGAEALSEALAAEGISEEVLRAQVSADLATQAYLEQELSLSSVVATDEEVQTLYAQAAAQDESLPPLEEIRSQVEQSIVQQKQQALLDQLIAQLRAGANVEILL